MIRLAILSPTPALRTGVRGLLASDENINILAETAIFEELELDAIDVLVTTSALNPEMIRPAIEQISSSPAILFLGDDSAPARSLASLPLRAWGMLPLDASEEELLAAVHAVHEGLLAASPALMQPLLGPATLLDESQELAEELTEREDEVLQLLAQGMANKQIALRLSISEHTVKFHVSAIYAKLGVTNRTEAVGRGARLGLIVL